MLRNHHDTKNKTRKQLGVLDTHTHPHACTYTHTHARHCHPVPVFCKATWGNCVDHTNTTHARTVLPPCNGLLQSNVGRLRRPQTHARGHTHMHIDTQTHARTQTQAGCKETCGYLRWTHTRTHAWTHTRKCTRDYRRATWGKGDVN